MGACQRWRVRGCHRRGASRDDCRIRLLNERWIAASTPTNEEESFMTLPTLPLGDAASLVLTKQDLDETASAVRRTDAGTGPRQPVAAHAAMHSIAR
jgi:hypothetical protein